MPRLAHAFRYGLAALTLTALSAVSPIVGQDETPPASFTPEQAEAGQQAYAETCAVCHGSRLNNGQFGPVLKGAPFRALFFDRPANALFDYMSTTMPTSAPGSLQLGVYAQIMAYIMDENGIEPSDTPLPDTPDALAALQLTRP